MLTATIIGLVINITQLAQANDSGSLGLTLRNLPAFLKTGNAPEITEIKCGPIKSFTVPNLGILKVRLVYKEEKNIYDLYKPYNTAETVAYEASSEDKKLTGVLDFYGTDSNKPLEFTINGQFLEIKHKYGTHDVSILRLFSVPSAEYDASRFYPGSFPCKDEMD